MSATGSEFPFLAGNGEMAMLTRGFDWAQTPVGPPDQWPQSLRTTVGILLNSRFPMFLFWGRDFIQFYNDAYRPSLGMDGKHPRALGQRAEECFPEIWPDIRPLLDQVMNGGGATWDEDRPLPFYRNGQVEDIYWTFSYSPVLDDAGKIGGVLTVCSETTEQVKAAYRLAESEQALRSTIAQAPVAMFIFRGEAMVIEHANEAALAMIKRTDDVIGKPLLYAVPELAGSPAYEVFQGVYRTGQAQYGQEVLVPLERAGILEDRYFNFAYTPLIENGQVVGVMDIATEVTETVLARQAVEQSEKKLKEAVELAELGTWSYDMASRTMSYSPRMQEWYGFETGEVKMEDIVQQVVSEERGRVSAALEKKRTASDGEQMTDDEHRIVNRRTGHQYILHSVGKTVYDSSGNAVRVEGTTRDVTIARNQQAALEQEVRYRTEALEQANADLKRSNEELAQYAYIASHDLQEPLRKIQVFSGMLGNDPSVAGQGRVLLEKIIQSTSRMSTLIRDLLNFSSLLNAAAEFQATDLNETVAAVINDFELVSSEKGATIRADNLPRVEAISLQMNQLFYNLIGNALKFTRPGVAPRIRISSDILPDEAVKQYIQRPLPDVGYHRICIEDNGIGFEAQYSDQIFDVFKRLHSRETYPGTGIGLALCRRIMTRHQGCLVTESVVGEGSSFCLVLPDRQG